MDYYAAVHGDDWVEREYGELASTDPRSFWSTSTMGGWVANGEVAYGMGLATWIMWGFVLPDFSKDVVAWGDYHMTSIQMPSYGVVKDASNPNAAKLFKDWMLSETGQLNLANGWGIVPTRRGLAAEKLPTIPFWGYEAKIETILEEGNYLESIFMEFNKRTTRSSQKAKYKDMWYNLFN
ncbi:MAG: hypothetical protein ABEH64_12575 [Salinirussus sp.]